MATDLHTTHVIINWSAVNMLVDKTSLAHTIYHSQNLVSLLHCIDFTAVCKTGFSESQQLKHGKKCDVSMHLGLFR
jgi:alkyl hydroperoxide reductase subunit AhpC